jgi:hypothetical protein
MEDDNICPICFDSLNVEETNSDKNKKLSEFDKVKSSVVTLDCRHKFHYECILEWFKNRSLKYPYSSSGKSIRICPYCRNKTGYIELPKNAFPIKHIHKEFSNIQNCINCSDYEHVIKICKPYFNPKYCFCILKTGKSKGQQCRKYKTKDSEFCHIHNKKYNISKEI